jgi:hypothetical protein
VKFVGRDFKADDAVWADFKAYLTGRKLRFTDEDLTANHELIGHIIEEEVLRYVFGEAEARKRSMSWDPQILKSLDLVQRAELLLKNPQRYLVEREAELKVAAQAPASPKPAQRQ